MASADSDPHGSPAGQAPADQGEAVLVRAVGQHRLADRFRRWRTRLLA